MELRAVMRNKAQLAIDYRIYDYHPNSRLLVFIRRRVFNKAPISWDFLGISSPVSGKGDCAYYTIWLERRQLD